MDLKGEIDEKDRQRYRELFDKLDVNKDGRVELTELVQGLKSLKGVADKDLRGHAQDIIAKADQNEESDLDFAEFAEYMQQHEQKLKLAFSDLDRNKDGHIEPSEIQAALSQLGLNVDLAEAEKLTKRLDKDGSLSVDWDEWRNFFQLYPSDDLETMVQYWRQSLMIDIGEQLTVPPEFTAKERKSGMWWRHLVAGGMAGAISRTCTAPLDRVKIMLQVHGGKKKLTVAQSIKLMIKEGGVKSLWRGNGTNVIKIAPESAIKFAAYEQIKRLVVGDTGKPIGMVERFAAGSSAGAIAQTCIYPLEVVKTRLAVMKTGQYKGMVDCLMKIYKKEGFIALYRGYLPNLLGIIPYAGIDLTIYETLKNTWMARSPDNPDPGVMTLLACGTVSSTCGQLASYPLALVRTRLQARATPEAEAGFLPLTKHIIKTEGLKGLYRGIAPNFMKVLPAVSISYVIYEKAKGALGIQK